MKASNGIELHKIFDKSINHSLFAKSFVLQDNTVKQEKTLAVLEIEKQQQPASLSKLVTAMLIADKVNKHNINVNEIYINMPVDLLPGSSKRYQFFKKNEQVLLSELLKAMLITSSNESAYALGCWHSENEIEFVSKMNEKIQEIGLKDTLWTSSSGLNRKAYATASDMMLLATHFVCHYSNLVKYCGELSYEHNGKVLKNTNQLIDKYDNVIGLKTGNLVGVGSNLINYWMEGDEHNISIVLCAKDRKRCMELSESIMTNHTA